MVKGLFLAAGGMKTRLAAQDIITNNLANAGTAGFQREIARVETRYLGLPPLLPGATGPAGASRMFEFLETTSVPDTRPGLLHQTHSETDVALEGTGYLTVQTARGLRLSRGGPVSADAEGYLSVLGGDRLLGIEGSPIRVGSAKWQIAPDGTVTAGGAVAGRLRVVIPEGPLAREGNSLFAPAGVREAPPGSVRVLQGFQERSNVEPVREMVDMITGVRAYESAQRAVLAQDQTLQALLDVVRRG